MYFDLVISGLVAGASLVGTVLVFVIWVIKFKQNRRIDHDEYAVVLMVFILVLISGLGFFGFFSFKHNKDKNAVEIINTKFETTFRVEDYYYNKKLVEEIIEEK